MSAGLYGTIHYAGWFNNDCQKYRNKLPCVHITNAVTSLIASIVYGCTGTDNTSLCVAAVISIVFNIVFYFMANNFKAEPNQKFQ